jgi:multidrug transporter EmrE-like cation transporter
MTTPKIIFGILIFWAMQITAQLLFKWGSDLPGRSVWGFVGGNLLGVTSIVFLMLLYKTMNANVAMGICLGGAFLLAQVAVALLARSTPAGMQYAGILGITSGMVLLAVGKPPPTTSAATTEP